MNIGCRGDESGRKEEKFGKIVKIRKIMERRWKIEEKFLIKDLKNENVNFQ